MTAYGRRSKSRTVIGVKTKVTYFIVALVNAEGDSALALALDHRLADRAMASNTNEAM
jgi:hypothetical protein